MSKPQLGTEFQRVLVVDVGSAVTPGCFLDLDYERLFERLSFSARVRTYR
jgi:hypothetical protein